VNFPTEFLHKNIRDLPCPCLSVGVNGAEFGNDPVTSKVKLKPPKLSKNGFSCGESAKDVGRSASKVILFASAGI